MASKVVDSKTFAEIMQISHRTVSKMLREKRLPGYKFSNKWFIKLSVLEAIQNGSLRIGAEEDERDETSDSRRSPGTDGQDSRGSGCPHSSWPSCGC